MSEEAARLQSANPSALPPGTRLGEFELLRLLGVGGFGIVYLAFDHALEREVAVKEYMPASLAGRTETMRVSLRSQSDADTFALGLKSFVNEARLLARFDHPSLLKVLRFWEANGTAYMAMPVMRGRTVKEVRQSLSSPPEETWLRALLDPLLGAIERLHAEGVYHRDIAPDNIQIEPDGHPVLLDFGAARRVLSDKSQTLTAILKPAYAPIEQYAEAGSVKQGPWTDLYALGATLHYLLLNRPPPPATTRAIHDEPSSLTTAALPGCSQEFLNIIDWMLAPRPADRPQSVAALRDALEGRIQAPVRRVPTQPAASEWDRTVLLPGRHVETTQTMPAPAPRPTAADAETRQAPTRPTPPVADARDDLTIVRTVPAPAPAPAPAAALAPPKSRAWPIGLGVGALVLALAAGFGLSRKPAVAADPPVATAASAALAVPLAASAVLPASASVPESTVTAVVLPGAGPGSADGKAELSAKPPLAAPSSSLASTDKPVATTAGKPAVTGKPPGSSARNGAGAAPVASTPVVAAAPPAPESNRPKTDPDPASAPAPVPVPVVEAAKPLPTGPEAICAGKNFLMHFACMEQECLKSAQLAHADCKKWRAAAPRSDQ